MKAAWVLACGLLLSCIASPATAVPPRIVSGATATLLPDGNVLIVGGSATTLPGGGYNATTVQIDHLGLISNGPDLVASAAEDVTAVLSRSSHTATLLPNGNVIVAGGVASDGTVRKSILIYNPRNAAAPWVDSGLTMSAARYNHTATLLRNGEVLICGGANILNPQTGNFAGQIENSCDLYVPAGILGCAAANGCLNPGGAPTMLARRSLHAANLLPNGTVLFTGGWDGNIGLNNGVSCGDFNALTATSCQGPAIVTSEVYQPAAAPASGPGAFHSAHALLEARYNHTSTVMGDGRVLLAGGFNGNNVQNNFGILSSAEIYDPKADSVSPAAALKERLQSFAIALNPDGSLTANGGLGNVTTTFINNSPCTAFDAGSTISGTDGGVNGGTGIGTVNVTGGALACPEKITLNANDAPTGVIESGFELYSAAKIFFTNGNVKFTAGSMNQVTWLPQPGALFSDLTGTVVQFDPTSGVSGQINRHLPFGGYGGAMTINPLTLAGPSTLTTAAGGCPAGPNCIAYTNPLGGLVQGTQAPITGGMINANLTITGLPANYIGATLLTANFFLTGGNITYVDAFSKTRAIVSLLPGTGNNLANLGGIGPLLSDGAGGAKVTLAGANITSLAGTLTGQSTDPAPNPLPITNDAFGAIQGQLQFTATNVDMTGLPLLTDIDTVTIKSMVVADAESYDPAANTWNLVLRVNTSSPTFGGNAVLLPTGGVKTYGGRGCDPLWVGSNNLTDTCNTAVHPRKPADTRQLLPVFGAWTAAGTMKSARENHTATVLPNGQILLAGGSNGPNVLNSAELYDPTTRASQFTGSMYTTRDLHTATLLPNGRVLVAGGYTTTGSTGSTATAELFFPNNGNGYWIQLQSMSQARDNHATVLGADGSPVVIGGYDNANGNYLNGVEAFNANLGIWSTLASMTNKRALHSAVLLRTGKIMVAGGINQNGVLNSVEIYNPVTNIWSPGTSMPRALHSHRASMLPDGRVLVSGGNDGFGETTSSFIYDPGLDQWTDLGSIFANCSSGNCGTLQQGRFNHDALTLPTGVVVAIGGAQGLNQSLSSVESFDVYASSWQLQHTGVTAAGLQDAGVALTTPRAYQASVLANNGFIFTFGGGNNGTVLGSVEALYANAGGADSLTSGAPPSVRQSTIAAVDLTAFDHISTVTISGANFRGRTEASTGGANDSVFSEPRVILMALDGGGGSASQGQSGFFLDLSTRIYTTLNPATNRLYNLTDNGNVGNGDWSVVDSSISLAMPSAPSPTFGGTQANDGDLVPYGWYQLRTMSSALFSQAVTVHAGPVLPSLGVGTIAPIAKPGLGFYDTAPFVPGPAGSCTGGEVACEYGGQGVDAAQGLPPVWVTSNTIVWQWQNATAPNPGGYDVYSATNGVFITTISFSTTVFVQSGLAPNTTVSILVAPFNLSGDGPLSFSATFFTLSTAPVTTATSISSVQFAGVGLNWLTNGNQPGTIYEVSESTNDPLADGNQPFTTDVSTPVPVLQGLTSAFTTITGLLPSKIYHFRIRAMNGAGLFSNFSAMASTQTRQAVGTPSLGSETATSITWSWPDALIVAGVDHYNVYSTSSTTLMAQIVEPPLSGPPVPPITFTETSLPINSPHSIRISAVTAAGEGPLSTSATIYTMANVPAFAPGSAITSISSTSVGVQFAANGNPNGTLYNVVINNVAPLDPGVLANATTLRVTNAGAGVVTAFFNNADISQQVNTGPNYTGGIYRSRGYSPGQPIAINVSALNGDAAYAASANERPAGPLLLTPLNGGTTSLAPADPANPVDINPTGNPVDDEPAFVPPQITAVTNTSISISWTTSFNVSSVTYQVEMSADPLFATPGFGAAAGVTIPLAFAAKSNQTALTVGGLQTGTTYYFRFIGQNNLGATNSFNPASAYATGFSTPSAGGVISNGGAPPGSLAGAVDPNKNVTITGTLAGNRLVTLFIPAHTFPTAVTVTLSTQTFGPPSPPNPASCANGGPYGININVLPPMQPLQTVLLTLNYQPADIAGFTNTSQIALERVDPTGKCVPLSTQVNLANNSLTATLNHFSLFQMAQVAPTNTIDTTLIFPNPFMPTEGNGYVTFSQLPAAAHIQIFTLKGALVNEGYANASGLWLWSGTNSAGRPTASGVYLAVVRSGDRKRIFKVVVLR